MIRITNTVAIDGREIDESCVRAGPGGAKSLPAGAIG